MSLIIISNRAPINIKKTETGYHYEESPGGLASGLRAYVEQQKESAKTKITWLGWPGIQAPDKKEEEKIRREVKKKYNMQSVFIEEEVMDKFYEGFCNKTIWPLFHYFPSYAVYNNEFWETYKAVNQTFCNEVLNILSPNDTVWIHDYHLMLLPAMLRAKVPDATIGFFLHIPFPSYEVYRLLPSEWRKDILEGLFGADLIGFHTHDYRTYFLRSTVRILGLHHHMGEVFFKNRMVKVDTFPMGIDYSKYHSAATSRKVEPEKIKLRKSLGDRKLILSIDRQDYTKGILNRLSGYEHFLENNPQWRKKVEMIVVVVPSRIGVENYQSIKSKIDELVGRINGMYGSLDWTPVVYQYRALSFEELIALYNISDVALVTPLRDGMNLIAKEYIASRTDHKGVLILSEMAGAIDELSESIIINPNNIEEISMSLLQSLEIDEKEQSRRIATMQKRLITYDIFKWATDFFGTLDSIKKKQQRLSARFLNDGLRRRILNHLKKSQSRIFFLDYDGTLVPFANHPLDAAPRKETLHLLDDLSHLENAEVVIVSGRDRYTLEQWFGHLDVNIVAEHGVVIKEKNKKWRLLKPVRKNWKKKIIPIMNKYVEKLPGSFLEEKEFSLVFHYRRSDPAFASLRVKELMSYLESYTTNMDVQVLIGNHVLEMRNAGIDKGVAAMHWLTHVNKVPPRHRFILAVGDDMTDEDLFRGLPNDAYSIKVGPHASYARFNLHNPSEVINLLAEIVKENHAEPHSIIL